jgi:ankyrin repeat protein
LLVHQAAECGHSAIIPLLKLAGLDLNGFSADDWRGGHTPLMWAIRDHTPDRAVIKALLKAGAAADLKNLFGDSPLSLAYARRHKDIAVLLIWRGAPATPEIENWISKDQDQLN